MQKTPVLLNQVENLFKEILRNETINPKWIPWIKIAIWYSLDEIRKELFENWRAEQVIDETKTDEDYSNDFNSLIWFDFNDVEEKQFEKLNKHFISLNNK